MVTFRRVGDDAGNAEREAALYNHPRSVEERLAQHKTISPRGQLLIKQRHEENQVREKHRQESVKLARAHELADGKMKATSAPRPADFYDRQKREREALEERQTAELAKLKLKHREEQDRLRQMKQGASSR